MILISPVITMGEYAHATTKKNLSGANPSKELIEKYSLEKQVTPTTPPAFIIHAADGMVVNPRNSLTFYNALIDKNISASLHIFPNGGHAEYSELYKRLGSYPHDQDPLRAGWNPTIPNNRWADPTDARTPKIPY